MPRDNRIQHRYKEDDVGGAQAKNCLTWDGKPNPQPILRKPESYPPNINVFIEHDTLEGQQQKSREVPLVSKGVRVFDAETQKLLKGEGGKGVDFAASEAPNYRSPKRPCAGIWKWQNREKILSRGMAHRAIKKKEERHRVKVRQDGAQQQHLQQAIHADRHRTFDALTGTNLTLCTEETCPTGSLGKGRCSSEAANRNHNENKMSPRVAATANAIQIDGDMVAAGGQPVKKKAGGKRFHIPSSGSAGSSNAHWKKRAGGSPQRFMAPTASRESHLKEIIPGTGKASRLMVIENTKFIVPKPAYKPPAPPPPKLGPAYPTKPYYYPTPTNQGAATAAPSLVKPCWIGRAPPQLSGTVQKEVDRVRWELQRLEDDRTEQESKGVRTTRQTSVGRGGGDRPLSARVKSKIAALSDRFLDTQVAARGSVPKGDAGLVVAPPANPKKPATVRPATAPTVRDAMRYQPARPRVIVISPG